MIDLERPKMARGSRASRERRSTAIGERLQQNVSEDEASVRTVENDSYMKHGSTLSQKRWTSSEDSSRPYGREIKTVSIVYGAKIENNLKHQLIA